MQWIKHNRCNNELVVPNGFPIKIWVCANSAFLEAPIRDWNVSIYYGRGSRMHSFSASTEEKAFAIAEAFLKELKKGIEGIL